VADELGKDESSRVYAVVLRGEFTMNTAHVPPGVEPPHADWIMLVLDPKDESVAGMAASTGAPDMSEVGVTKAITLEAE
jgi:hypothetical protein